MRRVSYGHDSSDLTPLLVIIIINVVVYIATLIVGGFGNYSLFYILGLRPALFFSQPWTIITNLFVHGGLWHLIANMFTLFFFGRFLKGLIGTRAFLTIYFLGGIMGNIFVLILTPLISPDNVAIPVIGASGAVFALGGALTILTPRLKVFVIPIPVPMPLWVAVLVGFLVLTAFPGVSWQGHLGGLALGLVAGWVLHKRIRYY